MNYKNKTYKVSKTARITLTALFTAIICVATLIIKIPIPATQGYIHFGDAFVMLSGVFPGGGLGLFAAGAGSALADIFSGYVLYAPVTFLIKLLCSLSCTLIYHKLANSLKSGSRRLLIGSILSIGIIVIGYFIFEFILYGTAAAVEVPANLIQGISGVIISGLLFPVFCRIPELKKYL